MDGFNKCGNSQESNGWGVENRVKCAKVIDPILGFNLEGKMSSLRKGKENLLIGQVQTAMDHDLEDEVVIGEEGKKRARGEIEESNIGMLRNRRMSEVSQLSSAAAKR
ncbi:hypothetical protein V6Z11_A12G209900 [Gossypium hirsutum]